MLHQIIIFKIASYDPFNSNYLASPDVKGAENQELFQKSEM